MRNETNTFHSDTIDYIASMASDLKIMASATRSQMLVYLLDLVVAEALNIQNTKNTTAQHISSKF